MKRIQSKALLLKKRVRTVQDRAKTAGMFYLLGIVLMAVAGALLTLVTNTVVSGAKFTQFPVVNAVTAVISLFKNGIVKVIKDAQLLCLTVALLLYIIMMLALVINILRGLSKLGWLFKTKASYTYGFNRNMYAMDDLGKIFSGSFSALILTNLFMLLFTMTTTAGKIDQKITLFGYIVLGVGLFFHILCGLIEGRVTLFTSGEKIEEVDRDQGLFVYFFRNLIQVALVGVILVFFVQASVFTYTVHAMVNALLTKNFGWFKGNLMLIIRFAVEFFAWIWVMVMVKHATASTEYNREGKYGRGMKNFTVFSLLTCIFTAGLLVFKLIGIGMMPNEVKGFNLGLLLTAIAGLVGFLCDLIFKSRKKREDKESTDNPEPVITQNAVVPPQMPMMPMMPMQTPAMAQNAPYQPVYVPVYCPYPFYGMPPYATAPAPVPVQNAETMPVAPVAPLQPAPAPAYLQPTPSPMTTEAEVQEAPVLEEVDEKPAEVDSPLDPAKLWMVRCPQCGKLLRVREVSPYHRCPACDKVFKLKKFTTYVPKN